MTKKYMAMTMAFFLATDLTLRLRLFLNGKFFSLALFFLGPKGTKKEKIFSVTVFFYLEAPVTGRFIFISKALPEDRYFRLNDFFEIAGHISTKFLLVVVFFRKCLHLMA